MLRKADRYDPGNRSAVIGDDHRFAFLDELQVAAQTVLEFTDADLHVATLACDVATSHLTIDRQTSTPAPQD